MDYEDEINLAVVQTEYEREREKWNLTGDLAGTSAKPLGCLSVFVKVFVGLLFLSAIIIFLDKVL